MFDRMTRKIAEKMGRSVQKAAEPIKTEMRKNVGSKVDLYSRIMRLGVLALLFIDGTRRVNDALNKDPENGSNQQIIINNYIGKDGDG